MKTKRDKALWGYVKVSVIFSIAIAFCLVSVFMETDRDMEIILMVFAAIFLLFGWGYLGIFLRWRSNNYDNLAIDQEVFDKFDFFAKMWNAGIDGNIFKIGFPRKVTIIYSNVECFDGSKSPVIVNNDGTIIYVCKRSLLRVKANYEFVLFSLIWCHLLHRLEHNYCKTDIAAMEHIRLYVENISNIIHPFKQSLMVNDAQGVPVVTGENIRVHNLTYAINNYRNGTK